MKRPKVSVIIPVYNTEEYIEECIESVLNQTFQDFEIICVDDGSTDRSADIIQGYCTRDKRIALHKQKNSFSGVARNTGVSLAKGKYIQFLDSDDFLENNALEMTVKKAEETSADVVVFNGFRYNTQDGQTSFN